jgi:hypothetical protein
MEENGFKESKISLASYVRMVLATWWFVFLRSRQILVLIE